MNIFGSSWQNAEGIQFHIQGWEPDAKPRAVVALVHGLGEHVARYSHVGSAFSRNGYALVGFDLRGHGRSGGPRGHTPTYEALMDDIAGFLAQLGGRYRGRPTFLYGHSMGGNLVLNYALRRRPRLRGVISTSPWLRLAFEPSAWKVTLARALGAVVPSLTLSSDLDASTLSHDPKVVEAYLHDPLVHDRISSRLFVEMRSSGAWALEHAVEFPLPLLLMHGAADRLNSCDASQEFAQRASKRTTWKSWAGGYHELHNEPFRARVIRTMIAWMDANLRNA